MSGARELLDAESSRVVYSMGPDDGMTYEARDPRPYAALRAVLDSCDFIDCLIAKYEPYEIAGLIREAITRELEGK